MEKNILQNKIDFRNNVPRPLSQPIKGTEEEVKQHLFM